jgi:hypothetical protein
MAKITISELHPANSESYLTDLNDVDSINIYGGEGYSFTPILNFGMKIIEAAIAVFAIYSIVWIAQSFKAE